MAIHIVALLVSTVVIDYVLCFLTWYLGWDLGLNCVRSLDCPYLLTKMELDDDAMKLSAFGALL